MSILVGKATRVLCQGITGEAGKFHTQKGQETVSALENWTALNPTASAEDKAAAKAMLDDLNNALGG